MQEQATKLVQTIPDNTHLILFAQRLTEWLLNDVPSLKAGMESRAKALLKAANVIDDPTLHSFIKLVEGETAVRCALYDLLDQSGLGENPEVAALAAVSSTQYSVSSTQSTNLQSPISQSPNLPISWLGLAVAAFAWKTGYPLAQLDPASPPNEYSPAGQVVKRAAHFIRQQVQRGATERDKLGKKLSHKAESAVSGGSPTLDQMPQQTPIAPVPPHFRMPVPVRYPEVARETLKVEPAEPKPTPRPEPNTAVPPRSEPVAITDEDLMPQQPAPTIMPSIRITQDQIRPEPPRPARPRVVMPPATTESNFATAVRQKFGNKEAFKVTKLRVVVQEYPDGPGFYGLQVRVSCQGIRSHVAGTTDRNGKFLCELPVRVHSGLTYEIEITWPRDLGGDIERKAITLNADRTEFTVPFHRRSSP